MYKLLPTNMGTGKIHKMSLEDITHEDIENATLEARTRNRAYNYDDSLKKLFDLYEECTNGDGLREHIVKNIAMSLINMELEGYSPRCVRYYVACWQHRKEKIDKDNGTK